MDEITPDPVAGSFTATRYNVRRVAGGEPSLAWRHTESDDLTIPANSLAQPSRTRPAAWIIGLLFTCAVINYIDRQALSVALPKVGPLFGMGPREYGRVVFCFLLAYAIGQPLAGRLLDRIGSVAGFAWAVAWWSLACALHAAATGVVSFGVYRFLLGFGEAALIPASIKTISERISKEDRAYAIGWMNGGISFGGMIATPIIGWMLIEFDWRVMFIATGALGLLWLGAWLTYMPKLGPPQIAAGERTDAVPLRSLLRQRAILGLVLARVISDAAWYFYLFWLPGYLASQRGFDMKKLTLYGWIPYATATVGALASGLAAKRLLRAGWSVDRTRKSILLCAAVLMPFGVMVGSTPEVNVAFGLVCLVTFLIQVWATSLFAIPADLFPPRAVGTAVGFAAATGSAAAMLFQLGVGEVVARFSYTPVFVVVALMHPVALACLWLLIPRIEPAALRDLAGRAT